ncbi:hypothetical protein OS493_004347 [Desmophyllum pertusum]|uniref:Uncharacterized protein n=1 Tax=Desmophyllum pertusum TaxID=174260 RepID=A0A9X0D5L0_9CNID|nr:hypothetical protein OS493_004347 [Desmophyllum pertusum]
MNQAIVKVLIMLALFTNTAHSGPLAYGICQTGCNFVWVACVAAAGGVAGVSTGGVGVPAVILACNVAQGVCMTACVAAEELQEATVLPAPVPPVAISGEEFLKVTGERFKEEVRRLQEALQHHCGKNKRPPIYDPAQFLQFCSLHGAANVFNFILSCMTSSHHSDDRILLNRKRTVVILYQLCFGFSQKCNFFQEDNGLFLQFSNLTQCGIETQRQLGTSCSSKVISRNRDSISKDNINVVNNAIQEAMDKKQAILMMIDDYHNIHTIRRPCDEKKTYNVDHMCTIIIKIVKEEPAIPVTSINLIHNPNGIDVDLLLNNLCSNSFFCQVSCSSFASSMPELACLSFDPIMGGSKWKAMTTRHKMLDLCVLLRMFI